MSKISAIMISIILVGLFITGMTVYMGGFEEHYDITIDETNWSDNFTAITSIQTMSDDITDILEDENTNWAVSGLKMGYTVLKNVFTIPKVIITGMSSDIV